MNFNKENHSNYKHNNYKSNNNKHNNNKNTNSKIKLFFEDLILDFGKEYIGKKINQSKTKFLKYIEKEVEKLIKKLVKKMYYLILFYSSLTIGILFILIGIYHLLINLLASINLPQFIADLSFGIILLLISGLLYLFKN